MPAPIRVLGALGAAFRRLAGVGERILALGVFACVCAFAVGSARVIAGSDWTQTEAFYEVIYRALLLVIGLELVRMLVTHDLAAVLELLAFVIARKLLKPEVTAADIALSVAAFVGLLAARRFFLLRATEAVGGPDGPEGRPAEGRP
jgi:hypothetical protein